MVQEQLQVDAYQQQYSVASAKVAADDAAVAAIGRQFDADQQQIATETHTVRELAIRAYMSGGKISGSDGALFTTNVEQAQLTNEYAAIAAGGMETALDQLQASERALDAQRATLEQAQAQDQAAQTRQAAFLTDATGAHQQLALQQHQVTGQLAAAVASQAAAQSASAVAAVNAAQRVAGTGSLSAGSGDPVLNAYLQCVVRAESGGNYGAVSPNGFYMGAFQFSQATWNGAARAAGRPDLVGVPPNRASKADQDTVAVALYALDGHQPWLGDRCG